MYGRVYAAADSAPITGAALNLRPLTGDGEMNTRSKEQGVYAFFWMDGPHSYTLSVSAHGFTSQETRVVRNGPKPDIVMDFYLRRAPAATLSKVKVLAASRGISLRIGGAMSDRLGMDRSTASTEQLSPEQQGNVNALAAGMSDVNVTTGPDGQTSYSALGLAPSQNNVMLNGSTFSGTALPRDAVGLARFARTPFDPSRGGFSGGQISMVLLPGSNNSINTIRLTGNSSRLTSLMKNSEDRTGPQSQLHVSGTASGAIVPDRIFYNTSAQVRRRSADI
ncbi:MAG: carboxypeptidase-like regulatory domain-containing protein, partial [Gemmatimonadaceae bacterium]